MWPHGLYSPSCREALVAGRPDFATLNFAAHSWPISGGTLFQDVAPTKRPQPRPSLPGGPRWRPSWPGGPRCREALVAGRPSLPGGGPRCREPLVAGRPSLPGVPPVRGFPVRT